MVLLAITVKLNTSQKVIEAVNLTFYCLIQKVDWQITSTGLLDFG